MEDTLSKVEGITDAQVNLKEGEATLKMQSHVEIEKLKAALQEDGDRYKIHLPGEHVDHPHPLPPIKQHKHKEGDKYYCPMLCEGDKKYDKPGDCPVCGMDLEKETNISASTETKYTCPMHPEVIEDEPGSCPKCGMELEPLQVQKKDDLEEEGYKRMLRKFWIAVGFTLPVFVIAMGPMVGLNIKQWIGHELAGWLEFLLATPVVFYCSGEFFKRGYKSIINKSPNMWTLISIGAGAAYIFSVVALLFPELFPPQFKSHGSVHLYFEAATVILTLI